MQATWWTTHHNLIFVDTLDCTTCSLLKTNYTSLNAWYTKEKPEKKWSSTPHKHNIKHGVGVISRTEAHINLGRMQLSIHERVRDKEKEIDPEGEEQQHQPVTTRTGREMRGRRVAALWQEAAPTHSNLVHIWGGNEEVWASMDTSSTSDTSDRTHAKSLEIVPNLFWPALFLSSLLPHPHYPCLTLPPPYLRRCPQPTVLASPFVPPP